MNSVASWIQFSDSLKMVTVVQEMSFNMRCEDKGNVYQWSREWADADGMKGFICRAAALRITIILRFLMCEADEVLHYLWSLMRTAHGHSGNSERDYVTRPLEHCREGLPLNLLCKKVIISMILMWKKYSAGRLSDVWCWGANLGFISY